MGEGREGDLRVPLISCLFFLCLITGGAFLFIYVFFPDISQPWFVIAALVLISFPWMFWLFMYIYACTKTCIGRSSLEDRQISRRSSRTIPMTTTATTTASAATTSPKESQVNSPDGQRHVHFGDVVVMDVEDSQDQSGNNRDGGGGESSVASSRECEMPLRLSVSS